MSVNAFDFSLAQPRANFSITEKVKLIKNTFYNYPFVIVLVCIHGEKHKIKAEVS